MDASLVWIIVPIIGFAITYAIVRWYEKTGEWDPQVKSWKHAPRAFPDDAPEVEAS
jgi:phosphate/sulfate permease